MLATPLLKHVKHGLENGVQIHFEWSGFVSGRLLYPRSAAGEDYQKTLPPDNPVDEPKF